MEATAGPGVIVRRKQPPLRAAGWQQRAAAKAAKAVAPGSMALSTSRGTVETVPREEPHVPMPPARPTHSPKRPAEREALEVPEGKEFSLAIREATAETAKTEGQRSRKPRAVTWLWPMQSVETEEQAVPAAREGEKAAMERLAIPAMGARQQLKQPQRAAAIFLPLPVPTRGGVREAVTERTEPLQLPPMPPQNRWRWQW